jgi:hypothetical protein
MDEKCGYIHSIMVDLRGYRNSQKGPGGSKRPQRSSVIHNFGHRDDVMMM